MSGPTPHSSTGIPIDTIAALAGKLQETAEAMLVFCRSASTEKDSAKTEDGELLEQDKAENIAAALDAIYNGLFATVFPMKGYDANSKLTNFTLYQIGELLSRSLGMLSKTGSVLADYNLIHVQRIPTA